MTLIVAWAKAGHYVLMTYDHMILIASGLGPDGWKPAPACYQPPQGKEKVIRASSQVLAGASGCMKATDYFRRRLKEEVRGDADLGACQVVAKQIVRDIWKGKGLDLLARWDVGVNGNFAYMLAGFYEDGTVGLAGCTSDQKGDSAFFEHRTTENQAVPLVSVAMPYGLEPAAADQYLTVRPGFIDEDSSLPNAYWRAFNIHHALGNKRPDRVSERFSMALLYRLAGPPAVPVHLVLEGDRRDVERAGQIYQQLANLAALRPKLGDSI